MQIGILGHAGAGKDTIADRLVAKHGAVKIAMADPLKRICMQVFKFTKEQLWGPSEMRNKPDLRYKKPDGEYLTPRFALQTLGTEWGRRCYPLIWGDLAREDTRQVLQENSVYVEEVGIVPGAKAHARAVVHPDLRFLNEVEKTRESGGYIIRLRRAGKTGVVEGGIAGHASEEEQKSIPDSLVNLVLDVPEGIEEYHRLIDTLFENGRYDRLVPRR